MNIGFAIIGLAVAAIGLFVGPKPGSSALRLAPASLVLLFALCGLSYGLGVAYKSSMPGLSEASLAAFAAAVVGVVVAASWSPEKIAVPVGLGLLIGAACTLLPFETRYLNQLGVLVGLGWAAIFSGNRAAGIGICSVVAAAIGTCDYLAAPSGTSTFVGSALGVVIAISCFLARFAKTDLVRALVVLAAMAAGCFALKGGVLEGTDLGYLFLSGALVGGVVHMLVDDDATSGRILVSVLLWLGLATVGFSFGHGAGIAAALLGGIGVPLAFGNLKAISTTAPLAGIAMYRIFRERYPASSDAVDIGQHYAMIGLIAGILLPLLPEAWLATRPSDEAKVSGGKLGWCILLFGAPAVATLVLGDNGLVGLATGMAFAAVVSLLRGMTSSVALPVSIGLAAVVPLGYEWFSKLSDLTRDEKLKMFVWIGVAAAIVALLIFVLSPKPQTTENPS